MASVFPDDNLLRAALDALGRRSATPPPSSKETSFSSGEDDAARTSTLAPFRADLVVLSVVAAALIITIGGVALIRTPPQAWHVTPGRQAIPPAHRFPTPAAAIPLTLPRPCLRPHGHPL